MKKFNYYNAVSSASILLTMLVISAEFIKPLKDFLASVFFHHWIGKAVVIILVFILVGFLYKENRVFNVQDEKFAWNSTIISLVMILLFFIIHYFIR
ncbi:hypothetical protein J4443_03110 [Candidatus Woesearchaeota archaeon]|nr:hypothetical protein [Candidatus Woesearchaeota archaeon]